MKTVFYLPTFTEGSPARHRFASETPPKLPYWKGLPVLVGAIQRRKPFGPLPA